MAAALLVIGALFELGGIVALGYPDLLPDARRLSVWLGRQWRRAANRVRRLLGRPPRAQYHSIGAASEVSIAGQVSAVVSASATTLEGKVEFLLRRDQEAQRKENEFAARLTSIEAESSQRLAELRQAMEEHVTQKLAEEREAYRPLRVIGTIALTIGLACVTAATLLA